MGMVGGLASQPSGTSADPARFSSLSINSRHDLRPPLGDLPFLLDKCVFNHFPHRDERLRQHGVAAATSSPGRTDDSAILGRFRIRSANQSSSTRPPQCCGVLFFFKVIINGIVFLLLFWRLYSFRFNNLIHPVMYMPFNFIRRFTVY